MPDVNAPDATAYKNPAMSIDAPFNINRLKTRASGTALIKFPAVTWVGSPAPFPRKE